ncbi:MAG: AbrB/MazE/SpoVT family DNA-binding domain-containing protein [Ruminococcaceae bacterium]|nr:AbrB/MazE/SpoVT family DNA-binding domain-containing protein [Oscillospiraceae bacterium]
MRYTVEKKIDNLGRIVLPKGMREYYDISLNDRLNLIPTEEGILIVKSSRSSGLEKPLNLETKK